jgi:hypothetical protein
VNFGTDISPNQDSVRITRDGNKKEWTSFSLVFTGTFYNKSLSVAGFSWVPNARVPDIYVVRVPNCDCPLLKVFALGIREIFFNSLPSRNKQFKTTCDSFGSFTMLNVELFVDNLISCCWLLPCSFLLFFFFFNSCWEQEGKCTYHHSSKFTQQYTSHLSLLLIICPLLSDLLLLDLENPPLIISTIHFLLRWILLRKNKNNLYGKINKPQWTKWWATKLYLIALLPYFLHWV